MLTKILLVDDDVALAKTIERLLVGADYEPILAHTAEDGLRFFHTHHPDLALLDVMVPNMGGWELCRRLREVSELPVIFLTALGNVDNVVRGLELGGDDYVVKPFDQTEFLARVKAHLRRRKATAGTAEKYSFGEGAFTVDIPARLVMVEGKAVDLTPREFDLLTTLVCSAGRVIPTAELVRKAWGMSDYSALDNIKPYIHYLRKKIEADPASPRWILTVRGVGYRFADE
ncbi:MAG: response regulator transcription factor [Anaerolineae bacterium]